MVEERALLVYDPLTSSQTIVVQHFFEGTYSPFGLLIPTRKPAEVQRASERLAKSLRNRLHPRGRLRRTLDVEFVSWVKGCAIREVGDDPFVEAKAKEPPAAAAAETANLGTAQDRLHDWVLSHGFTLSPAQTEWISRLRSSGWAVVGVVVRPPVTGLAPPPVLRGPVLVLTHAAEGPTYAAAHPPFALNGPASEPPKLELAVLTEWAVSVDVPGARDPFFAAVLSDRDVVRIGTESGGLPWAFRRNGTLTAFELPRPEGEGIARFTRGHPRPTTKPRATPRIRADHVRLPIELLLLVVGLAVWGWLRFGRRRTPRPRLR